MNGVFSSRKDTISFITVMTYDIYPPIAQLYWYYHDVGTI